MAETMRAAVFSEFGGPEVVGVADIDVPEPGPGQVRVKVEATSMNHLDLWVRHGLLMETPMPHIGGSDIVGVVDAAGPGAESTPEGVRVVVDPSLDYDWYDGAGQGERFAGRRFRIIGEHTQGGMAEYAVVPAANVLQVPDGVSSETAAGAGLVFVTAWRALMTRAAVRAGDDVLVTGASGGVGTAAVQVAKLAGARVFAVTSGPENVERVENLGADVVYDRLTGDFSRRVWSDTGKRGVDVVFDTVGEAIWPSCLRALAVQGRLVTSGATTGASGDTEIRLVFWKQLSILGSTMGSPGEFRKVMRLVFEGRLAPILHEVMPLAEASKAHALLEKGGVFGKLVLVP